MIPDVLVKKLEVEAEQFEHGAVPIWGMGTSTVSMVLHVVLLGSFFVVGLGCGATGHSKDFWKSMTICKHCARDIGYSLANIFSFGIYGTWKENLNNPSWQTINDRLRPYINIDALQKHEREIGLRGILLDESYSKDPVVRNYIYNHIRYSDQEVGEGIGQLMNEFAASEDLEQIQKIMFKYISDDLSQVSADSDLVRDLDDILYGEDSEISDDSFHSTSSDYYDANDS